MKYNCTKHEVFVYFFIFLNSLSKSQIKTPGGPVLAHGLHI